MNEKKRLVGITIFGIVYILIGMLFLIVMPLFSILFIISGIGLFMLRSYGRRVAIITSVLGIVLNSVRIFYSLQLIKQPNFLIAVLLTYLFYFGTLYYFTRPKVKEQFK